jgi:exosome complex RNA-binding protein Csl4
VVSTTPTTQLNHHPQPQPLHIQYVAGEGTYVRNENIIASAVGRVEVVSTSVPITSECEIPMDTGHESSTPACAQIVTVSVMPKDGGGFRAKEQVIRVGQTIFGRVVRIGMAQHQPQQVMVEIVANPYGVLDCVANGAIRREDITKILPSSVTSSSISNMQSPQSQSSTGNSHVQLQQQQLSQSFCVGDWIAAKVISLGDDSNRKCYYLTTAESSLGVIYATCSTSGHPMIPVSNREMECSVTGTIETRKCARPPKIIGATITTKST